MKTYAFFTRLQYIVLAVILISSFACKKDKDEDKNFRVISAESFEDGVLTGRGSVVYQGERIAEMYSEMFDTKGDSSKTTVEYPNENLIIMTDYWKSGSTWELDSKTEYTYQNGNLIQVIYYYYESGSWVPSSKETYQYSGDNLVEEVYYDYGGETWAPWMKVTCQYDGDRQIGSLRYWYSEGWVETMKEEATYEGDKLVLDKIFLFDGEAYAEYGKYEYTYTGNLMSQMKFSEEVETGGYELYFTYSFTYDANNNLASQDANYLMEDYNEVTNFSYESGKGNYRQLYLYGGSYIAYSAMPAPTRSSLKNIDKLRDEIIPGRK